MKKTLVFTLFFANLAVIFFLWLKGSGSLFVGNNPLFLLIAFGRLAGLLLEYFLLIQILLMGRVPFFGKTFRARRA
jgi:hypothetical protein